jgi:hypothetical protein
VSYSASAVKIYSASAVKIYSATNSPVRFENNIFFYAEKLSSLLQRWRCSFKFRSRRIGSRFSAIQTSRTLHSQVIFSPEKQVHFLLPLFSVLKQTQLLGMCLHCRVARWFIFKPKIPILVNFGGPWNGKCWYI